MLGLRSKHGTDDRKSRRANLSVLGGIVIGDDGYYHPTTEDQIVSLVQAVAANKKAGLKPDLIRVRGALHSFPHSITGIPLLPNVGAADPNPSDKPTDNGTTVVAVCLDQYIGLTIVAPQDNKDPAADGKTWAVCQAGINMVQDPQNPKSTIENGLSYQISQRGFALPDLGGIAAQTVSGFMSTGSSGGSLMSSLYDNVAALRFVDGDGKVHACSRKVDPDLFFAAGVSLGLFGIITQVSFSLVPYFDVVGVEYTSTMAQCPYQTPWDPDYLPTDGKESKGERKERKDAKTGTTLPTLVEFLNSPENEFCRLNWFPQPGVNRMITWTAQKLTDYQPYGQTGPPLLEKNCEPYVEIGDEGSSKVTQALLQRVAGWLLGEQTGIDDTTPKSGIAKFAKKAEQYGYAEVIKAEFVNTNPTGVNTKNYHDWWWRCIPMDQQINYLVMPVVFTELWMPIQYTDQMMTLFSQNFKQNGWVASGAFAFEVYSASRSDFWLSMSGDWPSQFQDPSNPNQQVIRMDIYWPANAPNTFTTQPTAWYNQFWKLLDDSKIPYRAHWGKYKAETPAAVEARNALYPKMAAWKQLRQQFDPQNIFLPDYWKTNLGIETS